MNGHCVWIGGEKRIAVYLAAKTFLVMINDANLNVYEDPEIVESYKDRIMLEPGEAHIFKAFQSFFTNSILDIGIGAGRTTSYFAPVAQNYWGMDYSKSMVDHCSAKFASLPQASFVTDDARELAHFGTSAFDTAFFSFNGIDCIDYAGRNQVLQQVHRVLKPAGHFIFSFHNTGYLDKLYSYHWAKNPMYWYWNWKRMRRVNAVNGPKVNFKGRDHFILKDGGEDFRLDIMYISPGLQEIDLAKAGFRVLQRVENTGGHIVTAEEALKSSTASFYFVCEKI